MSAVITEDVLEIAARLGLAVLLGGIIGMEREMHGRAAGLRTHILVCLGAAVLVIGGAEMQQAVSALHPGLEFRPDPTRLAAGIVTGIGFLGAGAIIRSADTIHGLTTAACVWLVAAIGIACGAGYTGLASAGTAMALVALVGLSRIERFLPADRYHRLHVEADSFERHDAVRAALAEGKVRVQRTEIRCDAESAGTPACVVVVYHVKHKGDAGPRVVQAVSRLPGVRGTRWELERG